MPATWPFETKQDSNERREYDVEKVQFGGKYSQRVPNGSNPSMKTWELVFVLVGEEVGYARQFLDAHGGYRHFLYQDPMSGVPREVICSRWRLGPRKGTNQHILQATFEETISL